MFLHATNYFLILVLILFGLPGTIGELLRPFISPSPPSLCSVCTDSNPSTAEQCLNSKVDFARKKKEGLKATVCILKGFAMTVFHRVYCLRPCQAICCEGALKSLINCLKSANSPPPLTPPKEQNVLL